MTSQQVDTPERSPAWCTWVLYAAAIYNLAWGTWVVFFPQSIFRWLDLAPPRYPEIWQCVGMIVGVYGIGYAIAARDPFRHWPITLVGFLGKLFGPIGFLLSGPGGNLPWAWGWMLLTNDLVWWIPFAALLYQAFRHHASPITRMDGRRHFVDIPAQESGDRSLNERHPSPDNVKREESGPTIREMLRRFPTSRGGTLEQISASHPCLVVFLRHFGCTFSREAAAQVALNRGAFEARNVEVVVVHMGSSAEGQAFLDQYSLADVPHISDPSCELYRAFGLRRGTWRQLFGLRVWLRGFAVAIMQGYGVGLMRGDGFQLAGVFVLENGEMVDSYRSQLASDLPNLLQFTSAALACANSSPSSTLHGDHFSAKRP